MIENIDAFLFGPKFWCIVTDALRIVRAHRTDENQLMGIYLVRSLIHVLPCVLCRESYRIYHAELSPLITMQSDLLDMWFSLHHQVNKKLGIIRDNNSSKSTIGAEPGIVLTREKFEKRIRTWTCFSSEQDMWDVLFMLAVAYPEIRSEHIQDETMVHDRRQRQQEHVVFVFAWIKLFAQDVHHCMLARALQEQFDRSDLRVIDKRDAFIQWVYDAYITWCNMRQSLCAIATGSSSFVAPSLSEMRTRYEQCKP